jgi:hypothetical protein
MAGSGRRFVLEAVFLAGLAVAVGLAGLSTGRIIGVMALGWLLTALIELVSWRLAARHPTGVALPAAPVERAEEQAAQEQEPAPEAEQPPAEDVPAPAPRRRRRFWRRRSEPEEGEGEHEPPPRHVRLIPKPGTATETDSEPDAVQPPAERAEGA